MDGLEASSFQAVFLCARAGRPGCGPGGKEKRRPRCGGGRRKLRQISGIATADWIVAARCAADCKQ
ncbi:MULTISPECIES: hypothetical protein [Cupriavidus]|uniref:hypothetical protein n=1 Tax=Cupriavidus TaxID=106589 RepID=UPI0012EAB454|nr:MULTISPECIES: hypothetical protein [Cupriavidus]